MAVLKGSLVKWDALYVRLSRDDENEGDSNSIAHQIEILTKYCKDHGITNYKVYKDDGFSGTNFNRPGFKQMLADIEAGLVGTVIVKDMSRFGRNYLEVGLYTEIRFPKMGIRFIAVNDGVDSDNQFDNDFTPFRNIINEWYAKDTSKKIRDVFRTKGLAGERLGGVAPYGYLIGPEGKLIVDEETAPVVKEIFRLCVEGNGPGKIARILRERKIPTPGTIEFERKGFTRYYRPDNPYKWTTQSISWILDRDTYLGWTTNFKYSKVSYKSKKQVINPPEKRVTFKDTHEAIIDLDTWEIVQKAREQRHRPMRQDNMALFSGVLFCAECGTRLYVFRSSSQGQNGTAYICGHYRGRKKCTSHYIREVVLKELVLQNLQRVVGYAQLDEAEFANRVMANKLSLQIDEHDKAKKRIAKAERRIKELDTIIQRLYEDSVSGKITDERFIKLSATYEKEQAELEQSVSDLRDILKQAQAEAVNIDSFLQTVRKCTAPSELTPAILHEFVDKIIIHEADKSSGKRRQQIDVHYNFIGEIDLSPEYCKNTGARGT